MRRLVLAALVGLSAQGRNGCEEECPLLQRGSLGCFEARVEPWAAPFGEVRCALRCCAEALVRELGWARLSAWWRRSERAPDVAEPVLGMRSLLALCDGVVRFEPTTGRFRLRLAPQRLLLGSEDGGDAEEAAVTAREAAVVYFGGIGPGALDPRRRNATDVLAAALSARDLLRRRRLVFLVGGDASFPPPALRADLERLDPLVECWAVNVGPDPPRRVHPMPLGISSGPNEAWAATIARALDPAAQLGRTSRDLGSSSRPTLVECRGYRRDAARDSLLDALRARGIPCVADDKLRRPADYFARLLAARMVLCPRGLGVATFRAYEALLAGAVPVMQRYAPHDSLWAGLPVILLDDLANATPAALHAAYDDLVERRHQLDLRRGFAPYWIARLARAAVRSKDLPPSFFVDPQHGLLAGRDG